jgi:hypothetical protein
MSIANLDQYIAAAKQRLTWAKPTSRTSVAAIPFTIFDIAGNPGAGVLNAGNTANGVVPTDAVAGYPVINAFGGAVGYLSRVEFGNSVACRFYLYDRLFACGAYACPQTIINLTSQPSYAGRLPNAYYGGLEIWFECVTAITGNPTITVTYTAEGGGTGHTTGAVAFGLAPILGRCIQLPLAAGDTGVQKIESVTCTVATAGTFNIMVLRPVWMGRVPIVGAGDVHDLLRTGLPQIYTDSALYVLVAADSTATGLPELNIEVCNA